MVPRYLLTGCLFFFAAISCSPRAQAQVFERGYLVLSAGDTLRGEVENLFWSDPPAAVRFRAAPATPPATYPARQLRGFGLASGRVLRRDVVPLDRAAQIALSKLPDGLVQRQQPDTVLADVLVDGPATLLEVKLEDVKHFLLRRETQPYLELTERRYLRQAANGTTQAVDGNNYHGQLLRYFTGCPAAVEVAAKAPFTAEGITRVVQAYNMQCSAEKQAGRAYQLAEKARSGIAVQVGPMLGVRYNTTHVHQVEETGGQPATLNGIELDSRPHGQAGIYVDFVNAGRRLALHTSWLYSRYGRTTTIPAHLGPGTEGVLDTRGNVGSLQGGLRWLSKTTSSYQWLLGAGAEVNAFFLETASVKYKDTDRFSLRGRGFGTGILPYLETGVRRDRLTLTLNGRLYGRSTISDNAAIRGFIETPDGRLQPVGYTYKGRTLSLALALAFRLNRADKPTK